MLELLAGAAAAGWGDDLVVRADAEVVLDGEGVRGEGEGGKHESQKI